MQFSMVELTSVPGVEFDFFEGRHQIQGSLINFKGVEDGTDSGDDGALQAAWKGAREERGMHPLNMAD